MAFDKGVIEMNLYLVQHAESKTEEDDPQKPLSGKGFSDIRKIAAFLPYNFIFK